MNQFYYLESKYKWLYSKIVHTFLKCIKLFPACSTFSSLIVLTYKTKKQLHYTLQNTLTISVGNNSVTINSVTNSVSFFSNG